MFTCLLEGNGRVAQIRQVDEVRFIVDITMGDEGRVRSHTEKYRHMAFAVALMWIDKGK